MKRKFLLLALSIIFVQAGIYAQTSCTDLNGFVSYKDTGGIGAYTLSPGYIEKAAQTYYYSGPGKISSVRIYGNVTLGIVPLTVGVYNVDNTLRPSSLVQSTNVTWTWRNNISGYIDVYFEDGGPALSNNFAVEVELRNASLWGNSFRLQYTGDGEGRGQDLASLAGTYTGGNWTSALVNDHKDGDFYIVPNMTNFITSNFEMSAKCIQAGGIVNFTNTSQMTKDSMFNMIGWKASPGIHYYEWNFGDGSAISNAINPSHTFATAGIYTVSLKSTIVGWNNTCFDIKTMRISVGLQASTTSLVNVNCSGLATGSVLGVGTGGSGVYTYSLNGETVAPGPSFTGLPAGNYTLRVADQLGCMATAAFSITQPSPITFSTSMSTNASCNHADGNVLVTANGGAGYFQYMLNEGSYQSSGLFGNLGSGSYHLTAKDTNGCLASEIVVVSDFGGPTLNLLSMTNVSCNEGSDGSIVVLGSGGSGTLQYSLNNGVSFQSSGSFPNLPAGDYGVMVKDADGCARYIKVTLSQPQPLYLSAKTTDVSCHGGANGQVIITSASGGTGTLSYSLDNINYQSYSQFSGLAAGNYSAYVKDIAGCVQSVAVVVAQPSAITAVATATNAVCYLGSDGSISVNATGGTPGYSFSINGEYFQPNGNFGNLSSANYRITVMDANNCSVTVAGVVNQPTQVTATINTTSATCGNANGGLLATASGGSGSGYLYAISETVYNSNGLFNNLAAQTYYLIVADGAGCGNIYTVNIADANGPVITSTNHTNVSCNGGNDGTITVNNVTGGTGTLLYSINGTNWQTSSQFNFLNAGNFVVIVKDANGCMGTAFDTLVEPNPFSISTTVTNLACYQNNSGQVVVLASGGAGVLAYSIDGGLTYQASNVFTDLSAGRDFLFVRDAAGCLGIAEFNLTQPTELNLTTEVLNVTCSGAHNGAVILKASGGTGLYTYSINDQEFYASSIFLYLSGGNDVVSVKDGNGCITSANVSIKEPSPLIAIPALSNVSCAGGDNGTIALNVFGGTSPYSFSWSNMSIQEDQFNLLAGSYTVTVSDYQGCKDTSVFQITQPSAPLVLNGVIHSSSNSSSNDGSVSLTVTGGDGPYTFIWSDGSTSQDISSLAPGNYSVNVKDANGCIVTGIFYVSNANGIATVNANSARMTIYPNPSAGNATVEVSGYDIAHLKVINVAGQVVFESEPNQPKVELQCNTYASGVYIVEVQVNDNFITQRMVINR